MIVVSSRVASVARRGRGLDTRRIELVVSGRFLATVDDNL